MAVSPPQAPGTDRRQFFLRLGEHLTEAERDGGVIGLLLIDVHNLPRINVQAGFEGGDIALLNCYAALREISTRGNNVYRVGDKRFAMILPPLKTPAFIGVALNKVVTELKDEQLVPCEGMVLDVRIGVALAEGGQAEEVLRQAEYNLHEARAKRITFSIGDVGDDSSSREQLERDFDHALRSSQFSLHYQPKVDLATGDVRSAESLLRWEHPELGFISPEITVDIASRSGRLMELTKWTLHTALREMSELQEQGLDLKLAVNVPAGLVSSPELGILVSDALAIWAIDAEQLMLEITESAVIEDVSLGSDYLRRIRETGVGLSIDDFGTGYSSLSYFKQIPAQELKIDRSFVENLLESGQDRELIRIIVDIAGVFGFQVVAEGIEDQRTLDLLLKSGCDLGQGFHIARPMPLDLMIPWLRQRKA